MIGGKLEVDGKAYFNGNLAMSGTDLRIDFDASGLNFFKIDTTNAQFLLKFHTALGRQFVIGGESQDYDHALQTNPTQYIHSAVEPDVSNNQWGSFTHDQEDFVITTGVNVGTGTAATTDDNGIKLLPRGGTAGLIVRGDGFIAHTTAVETVTTEANVTDPLTTSVLLITGDNDADNDTIELQDGDVAGQILKIIAAVAVDIDDTMTIDTTTDSTCTNCPAIVMDKVGENASLIWIGTTWVVTGLQTAL